MLKLCQSVNVSVIEYRNYCIISKYKSVRKLSYCRSSLVLLLCLTFIRNYRSHSFTHLGLMYYPRYGIYWYRCVGKQYNNERILCLKFFRCLKVRCVSSWLYIMSVYYACVWLSLNIVDISIYCCVNRWMHCHCYVYQSWPEFPPTMSKILSLCSISYHGESYRA